MGNASVIIEDLLQPISATRPAGEDMSFSSELDAIAQARKHDDPSLDQGEWVTELKEADWGFVVQHSASLLQKRSKDLRLAVWFAEANAKVARFRGLADGYRLIAELCDRFWDDLYPEAEDGDQERRIGNLSWLLSRSVQLVREMPVTEGRGTSFSIVDFETARSRAANAERLAAEGLPSENGVKLAEIDASRRKSSRGFYETLLSDAAYCREAVEQLEKSVDARLGNDGPGFSSIKEALDDAVHVVTRFAAEAGIKSAASPIPIDSGSASPAGSTIGTVAQPALEGPLATREQALNQLRQVADFFRRTEPHSPVAYLAEKAAAWGELPLHSWLKTVIKDPTSLAHVEELLGLQQQGGEEQ